MLKIRKIIVNILIMVMVSGTRVLAADTSINSTGVTSEIIKYQMKDTSVYNTIDTDYTKFNYVKYPWLVNSIVSQDTDLQNDELVKDIKIPYWLEYQLDLKGWNDFSYSIENSENQTKWISMIDTMTVLRADNGQSITDILGYKKSLQDYLKYVVLLYDNNNQLYKARMYYVSYEPDESGNLQSKIKLVTFVTTAKNVWSLKNKY